MISNAKMFTDDAPAYLTPDLSELPDTPIWGLIRLQPMMSKSNLFVFKTYIVVLVDGTAWTVRTGYMDVILHYMGKAESPLVWRSLYLQHEIRPSCTSFVSAIEILLRSHSCTKMLIVNWSLSF